MGAMIDAAGLSPLQTLRAIAAWLKSRPDNQGAENIRAQALEALEDKLRKQKAKIARLKNEAKKQDALADKVAKLELMNEADRKLRTLRTAIFEAEDAVDNAIKAGSGLPKNLAGLFPEADAILRKAFQSKKAEEAARPNKHEIDATPAPAQTITDHTSIKGRACTVKTAKGTRVDTVLALVEADSLIVSHDPASGAENPAFPQELQPRDRGRDSSQQWVQKTASRLDPDSLGRTSRADTGAPIIGPDRVVESGNGRSMAIQLAYQRGTADEYRQWLMDEAGYFGFEPDQVEAMRQPVLVRLRTSDIDRKAFVVEANQDDKLTFTATERAKTDAGRLNDHLIGLFAPSEDGDFTAASNQRFIQAFLQAIGDTEAAQYLTKDGKPTVALVHRLRAAVFSKAYNDDRLLEMMADQTKPEIQNVLNALSAAAPRFIDAQGYSRAGTEDVASGIVDGIEQSLDQRVVDAIVQATNTLMAARSQQQDVAEYVKQLGMFEELPDGVPELAVFLAQNGRSAKKMAIAFKAMAEFVKQDAIGQQSDNLFGEPEPPRMVDVVAAANAAIEREYGPEGGAIGGLFDSASMTPLQTLRAIMAWLQTRNAVGQGDGLSDRYTDENYRYKDVGYVPGSKKEQAQQRMAAAKKAGQLVTVNDIDWDDLSQDTRMAEHLITKANLMGKPDWNALRADGMPGEVGYLIKRIYAMVGATPLDSSIESQKLYARGLQSLRDRMEACRNYEEIRDELKALSLEIQAGRRENHITMPNGELGLTDQCMLAVALGKKLKNWIFSTGNKALHECRYGKGSDWDWLEPSDRPESGAAPKKPKLQLEAASNIQRVGPEVKVSSTAELQAMLGLRAVQSGNYVLKDRASAEFHIQRAAEAMQDMADVTGIPANLLGMGGRLALAFGARGRSGALAHYEPVQRVINITKTKGGGSLGHEYFHALDNMLLDLVKQEKGSASVFLSEQPHHLPGGRVKDAFVALNKTLRFGVQDAHSQITSEMWDSTKRVTLSRQVESSLESMPNKDFKSVLEYLGTVQYSGIDENGNLKSKYQIPLVLKAFLVAGLVDVGAPSVPINIFPPQASSFEEMALKADDGKRGRYWSKPYEMAARAYSAYLQDRLAEQGRVSDYLAYSTQGGNGRVGEWAYPQGEERKAINAAFDQLFSAIREEQVLEKAVANKPLMDALFGVDHSEGEVLDDTRMDSLADPDQTVYAVQQVPTDLISADPDAYQWRDNTDDDGTEDRPIDPYETWDEDTPPLILHRRSDSTLWVVDGHHRLAKAERLDVPEVPAVVLDEDDGYTVAAMRALCAMLNLTNEASEADSASYDPVILAGTAKQLMAMQ